MEVSKIVDEKRMSDLRMNQIERTILTREKQKIYDYVLKKYIKGYIGKECVRIMLETLAQDVSMRLTVSFKHYDKFISLNQDKVLTQNDEVITDKDDIILLFEGEEIVFFDRDARYITNTFSSEKELEKMKLDIFEEYLEKEAGNEHILDFLFEGEEKKIALENQKKMEKRKVKDKTIDDLLDEYNSLMMTKKILGETPEIMRQFELVKLLLRKKSKDV